MHNRISWGLRSAALGMAMLWGASLSQAQIIAPGIDHLDTVEGLPFTFLQFPPTFFGVPILLMGVHSDTVVQRHQAANMSGGSDTIQIELVALHLQSVAPINIGGSFFDVFVELDGPSFGQMMLTGTQTAGTFTSFFDVFFEVTLTEVGNPGNTQSQQSQVHLTGGGSYQYSPIDSFFDVFVELQGTSPDGIFVRHTAQSVPEPFTMGLGALAAAGVAERIVRRKRRIEA